MIFPQTIIKIVAIALISYLLGSINFSIILSRLFQKEDIRDSGSGNAGSTNMLRTYGKGLAALTIIGDIAKVALAIGIAFLILGTEFNSDEQIFIKSLAGFFCVLGHIYPLYFKFKGGKGVATCAGMVLLIDWRICLILFVIFCITVAVSKMVSLGSVTIAFVYPILIAVFYKSPALTIIAIIFALIVIFKHKSNIKKILNGTESKISSKKNTH